MSSDQIDVQIFKIEVSDPDQGTFYLVNGVESPRIYLRVGIKYTFDVDAKGHPFYLTTDARGGTSHQRGSVMNTTPLEVGQLEFTPDQDQVGMHLYYQCDLHPGMGYKLHVVS